MAKPKKIDFCPCGQPAIAFRQGILCCVKCEKREKGYWDGTSCGSSKLHGVSLMDEDIAARTGTPVKKVIFHDPDEDAVVEREKRIQFHLDQIFTRQDARQREIVESLQEVTLRLDERNRKFLKDFLPEGRPPYTPEEMK